MIRVRMKRRSNKPEAKKPLLMIKETVIRWQMMLYHSFDMIHTSSEFFSQSLSRAKGVCPYTPGLYTSPRLLEGISRSWCSKHFKSGTPDLFSSPGCSPSRQEMNSVSLFSFSNHSLLSSSSSPTCSDEQQFSSSDSNRNEPDASSVINPLESENKFVQNDLQAISLHSTPYHSNHPFSKRLHAQIVSAGQSFTAVVRLLRTYNPCHKS